MADVDTPKVTVQEKKKPAIQRWLMAGDSLATMTARRWFRAVSIVALVAAVAALVSMILALVIETRYPDEFFRSLLTGALAASISVILGVNCLIWRARIGVIDVNRTGNRPRAIGLTILLLAVTSPVAVFVCTIPLFFLLSVLFLPLENLSSTYSE
jgi:hypothetical protein